MRIRTKVYEKDFEIREMIVDNSLTFTVEIFKVPEGYKSFARNSYLHHYDLEGLGVDEDKEASVELAIKDLQGLMEDAEQGISK